MIRSETTHDARETHQPVRHQTDEPEEPQNPFKGTPFEQIFSQMGGFGAGGGMPDLNALMAQMQSLFAPHDGPGVQRLVVEDERVGGLAAVHAIETAPVIRTIKRAGALLG